VTSIVLIVDRVCGGCRRDERGIIPSVHLGAGVALIVAGASWGCVVAFGLWHRLPGPIAVPLAGLSGALAGVGGLLVQDDVGAVSWVVTMLAFVVLTPVHTRLVFGPPGPPDVAMVAAEGSAA